MITPPHQLVLETSAVCNLKCPQCWVGLRWTHRHEFFMPMHLFDKIINEAKDFIKHTYLHLWGEPTLNRDLPEMIRKVKAFSTVDLATHGLFITEELAEALAECDTLSVSIDGVDQETYERYRVGGSLSKAFDGLKLLIKKCPHKVNWTFIVFRQNEHQLQLARVIADEIGANIGFKPPLYWDKSQMEQTLPTDEKYRRYAFINGQWQLKADRLKCREFWETIYILPDGKVVTCCYDGDAEYVVGNVKESTLLNVWEGETYGTMRRKHASGMLNDLCERHCQLGN